MARFLQRLFSILGILTLLAGSASAMAPAQPVLANSVAVASAALPALQNTPNPTSVTIAGNLQSELGCSGDWQPDCAASHLAYDAQDDVWQAIWNLPASSATPEGQWQYKAALNDKWDENYGLHAVRGGDNIPLTLGAQTAVKFYYDHKTHWVTDNVNSVIVTAAGSFQSELGCPDDWQPGCLRSWLEDPDGDGTYTFSTTAIPAGNYEVKAALNEGWDINYGQDGVQNGPNVAFTVALNNSTTLFSYVSTTHMLSVTVTPPTHSHDNNVEWNGLRHDSRDTLYRTPGGAVPAGTPVAVRFRTFHNDVTGVKMRVYSVNDSAQHIVTMKLAAENAACYQADLIGDTCDYWEAALPNAAPDNLWYRFIVTDGTKTVYYADDTPALDGGLGAPSDKAVDQSWALMVYAPSASAPDWAKGAVIYQIFPDRFRNGNPRNDPLDGMVRYDDPAIKLPWGTLPEGFCRNYADGTTNCPWRFDTTPPADSLTKESPRGRDYFGGDLKGVTDKLDYLKNLGVTVIYFNPIFAAKSNHRYDTANYRQVDPNLGTLKDFTDLVSAAKKRGIKVVLDGVFNHMSSDSPFFDRYQHYLDVGACESAASVWRSWFTFQPPAPGQPAACAPSTPGGNDTYYNGWFGFDSIPVLTKSNTDVQSYFINAPNSVSTLWLDRGASGWRLDVMGDSSFPNGYWETFRQQVKAKDPNAVIIGELWQKDSTLLRFLRGDRADTTMDYRFRDAVIALLAPQNFDSKGFADSGRQIKASEFASRILSIREDYPDSAYYSLMNLLDSHDTERLLWTLTPGDETTLAKEQTASNVDAGKQRVKLASLIQFTMPGSPTVYYGDEVGMTGDDDPDDRRTFPWTDTGGTIDQAMLSHYQTISGLHNSSQALTKGDLRMLLVNDDPKLIAYGRKTNQSVSVVALNLSTGSQVVTIPVAGYIPDGTMLTAVYGVGNPAGGNFTVSNGAIQISLAPMSGLLLNGTGTFTPSAAPTGLTVTAEGNGEVGLAWNAVNGAAGYNIYRSPVSGGGYVKINAGPVAGTAFTDTGLANGQWVYYVVKAVNARGIESGPSNEARGMPHLVINWANTQWPPTLTHTISVTTRTDTVYGQIWIDGATNLPGQTPTLRAQLGYGPVGSSPDGNPEWIWTEASFNSDAGNNDEFMASLLPETVGTFDYLYRYTTTNGRDWLYADQSGPLAAGAQPANPGKLTVISSGDTTPPATPTGLTRMSASPAGIELVWNAVTGDDTLYGYEVLRSDVSGGSYAVIARVTSAAYNDTNVVEAATYYYVVRAVDQSFNRSGLSAEIQATAELRTVSVTFNVTVPSTTDATGRSVHVAGTLSLLDGGLPDWDPTSAVMTKVDSTHWTITLTGKETTQIQYKYPLGSWDYVEKDASCGEIGNRLLTLTYVANGTQTVNDTVINWRNVSPCGN